MQDNFFQKMPGFQLFSDLSNEKLYQLAPADWSVVVTDIEGSTKAIQDGRYKIVNMVGASTVAAIVNTLKTRDIPFVFGGDGATALIPSQESKSVTLALQVAQNLAWTQHQLKLRIGLVPHQDLIAAGTPVKVGKYQLGSKISLAFFKGQGLTTAEKWIKSGKYLIQPSSAPADFDVLAGLSCRWAPIPNTQGLIASVIIKILTEDPQKLDQILKEIDQIVKFDSPEANPVKPEVLSGEKLIKSSWIEAGFQVLGTKWKHFIKILLISTIARLLDLGIIKIANIDIKKYRLSLANHSDYRKFDEIIRMVIDISEQKMKTLASYLETQRKNKTLVYGIHESKNALMTCFVQNMEQDHLHFIDGGDGGYTLAAKQMKKQLSELEQG